METLQIWFLLPFSYTTRFGDEYISITMYKMSEQVVKPPHIKNFTATEEAIYLFLWITPDTKLT